MFQQLYGHFNTRFDDLEKARLSSLTDPIIQKAHTTHAAQELSRILTHRMFDQAAAREQIQQLLDRVMAGDLAAAIDSTKVEVRYWAARLCATDIASLASAHQFVTELRQLNTAVDLSIVDALIAETEGKEAEALRLLRDHDAADARSVLFILLSRSQGKQAALDWFEQQDCSTDIRCLTTAGWINWAICASYCGRWEEASRQLLRLDALSLEAPALAFVEGRVNAAMLLPIEYRTTVILDPPLFQGITPTQGRDAAKYHARATLCFDFLNQNLIDIGVERLTRIVRDWRLWLRLMDPQPTRAQTVRDEISKNMETGVNAVTLTPFTYAFDISFNNKPLKRYLQQRRLLGGLDDHELLAECLLYSQVMSPRILTTYLYEHGKRLSKIINSDLLTQMHVRALVEDNQPERARMLVNERSAVLSEGNLQRLKLMIDVHEGNDRRTKLEVLYQNSKKTIDLKNLISYLKSAGDYAALQPLVLKLFASERNVPHAQDVVSCLGDHSSGNYEALIQFLDANSDILSMSDTLKVAKAWALFHMGLFQDSKKVNDKLLNRKSDQYNCFLDINIAIASGDWERLAGVIDNEWPHRKSQDPETLIRLAHLVGQQGSESDRALQLAKLAVEKAPDDPQILTAAYALYFKLGHDDDADPNWLLRAADLSTGDSQPIRRISLRDIVTDWLPKRQKFLSNVERLWLSGKLPMIVASQHSGQSLARFLLHVPDQNAMGSDGRRRAILPIVTAAREPIELQADWTVGIDVTSIMVLAYLDLLDNVLGAFDHVRLSPDVMEFLFWERSEVQFHQPSRIAAAKLVRELQDRGRIRGVETLSGPPQSLTDEVGPELAALLHVARYENAKVICDLPIHSVGSLMEQQADIGDYDYLIHSAIDFCNVLHSEGKIDDADYRRAKLILTSNRQTEKAGLPRSSLQGTIYMDRTTLSYLKYAKILHPIAAAGLTIGVAPSILHEIKALIKEGDVSENLITKIEGIRDSLRNALDSGRVSFVPRTNEQEEQIETQEIPIRVTATLLAASSTYAALCIDERFINRYTHWNEPGGQSVPIVCVLDVLRYLRSSHRIDNTQYWTARHKLRHGGFTFIPIEANELAHWLKAARVRNHHFTESVELRVLRQTTSQAYSCDFSNPAEAFALTTNTRFSCGHAISDLWDTQHISAERAATLSEWVWRHLMPKAFPGRQHPDQANYVRSIRAMGSLRLGNLLLPTSIRSQKRRTQYTDWIERSTLHPLRPANSDIIENVLITICDAISDLETKHEAYGNLFLAQLPERTRNVAITQKPEFARHCGFETRRIVSIGPHIKLFDNELFNVSRKVLATNTARSVRDASGRDVLIDFEVKDQSIVVRWSDTEDDAHQAAMPMLALLSPNREARINTLNNVIGSLGPTAPDFRYIQREIKTRPLNNREFSEIFEEFANGVVALQTTLARKIRRGVPFSGADVVPQSISYFERFCGPDPNGRRPELYLSEVLVPYRKNLLSCNLQIGLDICCLGTLRDDLSPGEWVANIKGDSIWDVLSSCNLKSEPISLLGALDLSLYRQEDPRFREFAADAVSALSDESFSTRNHLDIYRFLKIFIDYVRNRINLLDDGSKYPGYWKRMCAWMQASLVVRALATSPFSIDIDVLEEWTHHNMVAAGTYAKLVDAREEPMLFYDRVSTQALRSEILGRLLIVQARHKAAGHDVPNSKNIEQALARCEDRHQTLAMYFPGPLEGHKRPPRHAPQELSENLAQIRSDDAKPSHLQPWVTASQLFALGERELASVHNFIRETTEKARDADVHSTLGHLELATIVAAANCDATLANATADVAAAIAPRISHDEEIRVITIILLQAAAALESHDAWFNWLEARFATIAEYLPPPPNESLRNFLAHLDEIERILPAESWFHLRARSIAASGAA